MDGLLAIVSGILIFVCALLILLAIERRRYRELVLITGMTIISGVICYASFDALPDSNGYSWYLKAAFPVGIFLFSVIAFLVASSPKGKRK
jgi:peptidoglycan/LPS O-acetylase OafA/YrhL